MADAEPPPWMRPGAPDPHAKKEAPPPPPAAAMDADEDIYGRETQEEADAKFMAALDANEARKAARQAALDLHAQGADAAWDERKPPPPPNDGYEEPSEEVLRLRPVIEKVFMATLTDPHYQKHPVPMVRSQHSHDACNELLDLCRLPEEELPQAHVIQRRIEQAWVDPDAWVRATAGSAAHAFGITQVADDFDAELRRKFGHLVTDEDRAGPRRWDPVGVFDDRWKSELVLPPLPEFEKHCNVRTDEEVREMMTRRTGAQAPRRPAAPMARGRGAAGRGGAARGRGAAAPPRFKPTQKRRAVVMLDDAPQIKPLGKDGRVKEPPKPKPKPLPEQTSQVQCVACSTWRAVDAAAAERAASAAWTCADGGFTCSEGGFRADGVEGVFGEALNLLDDAGRTLLEGFLRKEARPAGAGDKLRVHQEADGDKLRMDYLNLNWADFTYTRTRKRKAGKAPAA